MQGGAVILTPRASARSSPLLPRLGRVLFRLLPLLLPRLGRVLFRLLLLLPRLGRVLFRLLPLLPLLHAALTWGRWRVMRLF